MTKLNRVGFSITQGSSTHPNSLRSIVRERRSTNTSTKSVNGIPKSLAARSRVSNLGNALRLNQFDQCLISIPVRSLKSLYERHKNSSLLIDSQTCMAGLTMSLVCVILLDNFTLFTFKVTQTIKHLFQQMLIANLFPRWSGVDEQTYYEYNLLRDELCHADKAFRPLAWEGGVR